MKHLLIILGAILVFQPSFARENRKDCPQGYGEFCAQYQCMNIVTAYSTAKNDQEANDYQFIMPIKEFGIGNSTILAADENSYYIVDQEKVAVVDKAKLKDGKKFLYPLPNFGSARQLPSGRKRSADSVSLSYDAEKNQLMGEDTLSKTAQGEFESPQIYNGNTSSSKLVGVKLKLEEDLLSRINAGLKKIQDYNSPEVKKLKSGTLVNLKEDLIQCQKGLKRQQASRSEEEKKFLQAADAALDEFITKTAEVLSYKRGPSVTGSKTAN